MIEVRPPGFEPWISGFKARRAASYTRGEWIRLPWLHFRDSGLGPATHNPGQSRRPGGSSQSQPARFGQLRFVAQLAERGLEGSTGWDVQIRTRINRVRTCCAAVTPRPSGNYEWTWRESNSLPAGCKPAALPCELQAQWSCKQEQGRHAAPACSRWGRAALPLPLGSQGLPCRCQRTGPASADKKGAETTILCALGKKNAKEKILRAFRESGVSLETSHSSLWAQRYAGSARPAERNRRARPNVGGPLSARSYWLSRANSFSYPVTHLIGFLKIGPIVNEKAGNCQG